MNLVFLIDAKSSEVTPEGYLRIKAYATRTGVFEYPLKPQPFDKQLRSPDEVFKPESMATLKGKAVTIDHPKVNGQAVLLDLNNTKLFSKGYVEEVTREGNKLAVIILITDKELKDLITTQKLKELSAGYQSIAIPEIGTYEGQVYTSKQTMIVYNHLAVVKSARGGSELIILMDSNNENEKEYLLSCFDSVDNTKDIRGVQMAKINIDSVEFEVTEQVAMAVNSKLKENQQNFDSLEKNFNTLKGEKEQVEKQLEKVKSTNLDANDIDAKVNEKLNQKLDVIVRVKNLLPELNIDSKESTKEIMEKAIKSFDENFDSKDMSEDEVRGNFNAIERLQKIAPVKQKQSLGSALAGTVNQVNTDSKDKPISAYQTYLNSLKGGIK